MTDILKQIEAILFATGKKVETEKLAKLCKIKDISAIKDAVEELKKKYDEENSSLMITDEKDGYKLTVREKYLGTVEKLIPDTELSKTIMETLAVIAWKHPVLQSEIVKVRTNKAYEHISELEESGFLTWEKHGRTKMLRLTQKFFEYFDLKDREAIKNLFKDVDETVKEKQEEEKEKETKGKLEGLKVYTQDKKAGQDEEETETGLKVYDSDKPAKETSDLKEGWDLTEDVGSQEQGNSDEEDAEQKDDMPDEETSEKEETGSNSGEESTGEAEPESEDTPKKEIFDYKQMIDEAAEERGKKEDIKEDDAEAGSPTEDEYHEDHSEEDTDAEKESLDEDSQEKKKEKEPDEPANENTE